jgi:hypothetical protein
LLSILIEDGSGPNEPWTEDEIIGHVSYYSCCRYINTDLYVISY